MGIERKKAVITPKINSRKFLELLLSSNFGYKMNIFSIYAQGFNSFVGKGEIKSLIMPKIIKNVCYVNGTRDFSGHKCTIISHCAQTPIE